MALGPRKTERKVQPNRERVLPGSPYPVSHVSLGVTHTAPLELTEKKNSSGLSWESSVADSQTAGDRMRDTGTKERRAHLDLQAPWWRAQDLRRHVQRYCVWDSACFPPSFHPSFLSFLSFKIYYV